MPEDPDAPVSWVPAKALQLEVGQHVQTFFGDLAQIVELPGDGTVWVKPLRGEKFALGLDAFNQQFLVKTSF